MHKAIEQDAQQLKNRILKSLDDLPPMHEVVMKAQEIMADPNSDMEDLAVVIETDQAIVIRFLKLINSAHYGLSGKVSSIRQACSPSWTPNIAGSNYHSRSLQCIGKEVEGVRVCIRRIVATLHSHWLLFTYSCGKEKP